MRLKIVQKALLKLVDKLENENREGIQYVDATRERVDWIPICRRATGPTFPI